MKIKRKAMLIVGLFYGTLYFFLFRFAIRKWNLKTPGRETLPQAEQENVSPNTPQIQLNEDEPRGLKYLIALGGKENIKTLGACATRLRLEVFDSTKIDTLTLKALGARGVINKEGIVQVIIGPEADLINDEIHQVMGE